MDGIPFTLGETEKSPFKIGDTVKVVLYGHLIWSYFEPLSFKVFEVNKEYTIYDMLPEIVGKIGIVTDELNGQYSLSGVPGKVSWYDKEQLEKM